MTHEELLAKINEECATTYEDANGNVPMSPNALRAVVELHKPFPNLVDGYEDGCDACSRTDRVIFYPCLTIQDIEKALQ